MMVDGPKVRVSLEPGLGKEKPKAVAGLADVLNIYSLFRETVVPFTNVW